MRHFLSSSTASNRRNLASATETKYVRDAAEILEEMLAE
jgi:hypothetical protein